MPSTGVRFLSNLRNSRGSESSDLIQHSIDLLEMVPDPDRARRYSENITSNSGHRTNARHVIFVQDEHRTSGDDVIVPQRHQSNFDAICVDTPACRSCCREVDGPCPHIPRVNASWHEECSNPYNHQLGRYAHESDRTRDGSVYFNYLEFANRSRDGTPKNNVLQGSEQCYEALEPDETVTKGLTDLLRNLKPPKPTKPLENGLPCVHNCARSKHPQAKNINNDCNSMFSCWKKTDVVTTQLNNKIKYNQRSCGSSSYRRPLSSRHSSTAFLVNRRSRTNSEWCYVKILLYLVGILLAIMVALGGIVIGCIILAPHRSIASIEDYLAGQHMPDDMKIETFTIAPIIDQLNKDVRGWVYFAQGNGQHSGSRYTIINRAMMFSDAQLQCLSHGGHLPFITSIREQVFLEDFIAQELTNTEIQEAAIGFWLGARRARGSHSGTCLYKQWHWVDVHGRNHGIVNGFAAFGSHKPDNYFNPEECLYLSYADITPENFLKWDDAPCDIPAIGGIKVICEVDDS